MSAFLCGLACSAAWPFTEARDQPGVVVTYDKDLVRKDHTVNSFSGLLLALMDDSVDRILLEPGHYTMRRTLVLKRSLVMEAKVPGEVVLLGNSSCPLGFFEGADEAHRYSECEHTPLRVIDVPPDVKQSVTIELIGLNITGGYGTGGNGGGIRIAGGAMRLKNCNMRALSL